MMDFDGTNLVEKANSDPLAKVMICRSLFKAKSHVLSLLSEVGISLQLRSEGKQIQLSKVMAVVLSLPGMQHGQCNMGMSCRW